MVVCCILSMSYQLLMFIIYFPSFHNGLKHLWILKLVSILRAKLSKVVMKCKIVMFFNFWAPIPKMFIFEVEKFYPTKYQTSNQLIIFSGNFACKIHVFNGADPCQIIQNFWIMSPLYVILTSNRYHRDMKALKILASNSKNFRIYGTFNKWQIDVPRLSFWIILFLW